MELNMVNLEKVVKKMEGQILSRGQKSPPKFLLLSNFATGLGFTAQTAEEFIKQELENIS